MWHGLGDVVTMRGGKSVEEGKTTLKESRKKRCTKACKGLHSDTLFDILQLQTKPFVKRPVRTFVKKKTSWERMLRNMSLLNSMF